MKNWSDLAALATHGAGLLAAVGGAGMAPAPRFARSFTGAENAVGGTAGAAGGATSLQHFGGSAADPAASFPPYASLWHIDVNRNPWPGATASRRVKRDDEIEWSSQSSNGPGRAAGDQSRPKFRHHAGVKRPDQTSQSNDISSVRVIHFQPDAKAGREVSSLKSKLERHLADSRRQSNSVQAALQAAEDSAEIARSTADTALGKAVAVAASNADTQRQVVVNTIAIAALRRGSGGAAMADRPASSGLNPDARALGAGEDPAQLRQAINALQDRLQQVEENVDLGGEERSIVEEDIGLFRASIRRLDDQIRLLLVHDNFRAREDSALKRQIKALESQLAGLKSQCVGRADTSVSRRDDMHEINEIVAEIQLDIEILKADDRSFTQQIDILDEAIRGMAKASAGAAQEAAFQARLEGARTRDRANQEG